MSDYFEGRFGWARRVPDDALAGLPIAATTIAAWFVHAPNQGIGWEDYMISVVTLADVEGMPPAKLRYPKAEYELIVAALDPSLNPHPGDVSTWLHLQPINLSEQFHGITAEQAGQLVASAAQAVVHGRLPIETQAYVEEEGREPRMMFVAQIVNLWKTAIMRTLDHIHTGGLHERVN